MEAENIAQNLRPVHHRISNFVGAAVGANKIREILLKSLERICKFLLFSEPAIFLKWKPFLAGSCCGICHGEELRQRTVTLLQKEYLLKKCSTYSNSWSSDIVSTSYLLSSFCAKGYYHPYLMQETSLPMVQLYSWMRIHKIRKAYMGYMCRAYIPCR